MELDQILAVFDREQRREVTYPGEPREVTPEVVRLLNPNRQVSSIIYTDLNESNAGPTIRRELDYARELGYNLSWKVYSHDQPQDLKQRLATHGFEAQDLESVLVFELQENGHRLLDSGVPAGVAIRRITGPENIGDVITLEETVWGEDHSWLHDLAVDLQTMPEVLSMYAAYVDGVPASAAWIRFHAGSQFASLWGGSTLPAYRGRGLYTALLAHRAKEAAQRGIRFLTIDASPMSRPIVEKHGFQLITYAQDYNYTLLDSSR